MVFAILGIIVTVLLMCIPVAVLVAARRSQIKLMRPLGAGICAILASSIINALILLLYEDGGIEFLQTGAALAIRCILIGSVEAAATYVVFNNSYKRKISFMEAACVSVGMCIPMVYSRAFSIAVANIELIGQKVSTADGWQMFMLTVPQLIIVFFQPIMALFMALTLRRGKWQLGVGAYALMSTVCYNMNDVCTALNAGTWLKIVFWVLLLWAAGMQIYYIKEHFADFAPIEVKQNGARTRMKDDKYAWPDDSAFYDYKKPKQTHNDAKKKK